MGRIELEVFGQVEVEEAIGVQVAEGGARAPAVVVDRGRLRDASEGAVATVPVQLVAAPARHVEVRVGVGLDVGHGYSHAPADPLEARLPGDIGIPRDSVSSLVRLSEEPVAGRGRGPLEAGPADEEEVQRSVAVGVEDSGAGGHGLHDPALLRRAGDIAMAIQAGSLGHVEKPEPLGGTSIGWLVRAAGPESAQGQARETPDQGCSTTISPLSRTRRTSAYPAGAASPRRR